MKRFFLAAGLIATLVPTVMAQETKPAAQSSELSAREQGALGTYKSDTAGAPVIILKAVGKQLTLSATGLPDVTVTLNDKDELISSLLEGVGYHVNLVRDKDKKVTGLKVDGPQGGGDFQRTSDAPVAEKKKESLPDILGKYESDKEFEGMIIKSEVVLEKGKLILRSEGQPDYTITLNKDDTLATEPTLPDGLTVKMTRDKDGKVTGSEVKIADNTLTFTRKSFPKLPGAEASVELPDVLGKYEPEDAASSPVGPGEIIVREGKLVLKIDGQPDFELTVDKDLKISASNFPDGVSAKFGADKDGKIIKIIAATSAGEIVFIRKTFVKQSAAKTEDPQLARLKALEGTYTAEMAGLPIVKISVRDGKLIIEPEGQTPVKDAKLSDKDELTGEGLPEGFTVTIQRDKDGKVTGMLVKTPMGDAVFTRKPAA